MLDTSTTCACYRYVYANSIPRGAVITGRRTDCGMSVDIRLVPCKPGQSSESVVTSMLVQGSLVVEVETLEQMLLLRGNMWLCFTCEMYNLLLYIFILPLPLSEWLPLCPCACAL